LTTIRKLPSFSEGIEKKQTILIVSNSYPGFGGQSTHAYSLGKLLSSYYEVYMIFFLNDLPREDLFLDKDDNIIYDKTFSLNVLIRAYRKGLFNWLPNSWVGPIRIKARKWFRKKSLKKIKNKLRREGIVSDLVITNVNSFYEPISQAFDQEKLLFIVGSPDPVYYSVAHKLPVQEVISQKERWQYSFGKGIKNRDQVYLLFNSPLTQKLYQAIGMVTWGKQSVKYLNFDIEMLVGSTTPFDKRPYDIGFFVSDINRNIKNVDLALELMHSLPNKNHIVIGDNEGQLKNLDDFRVMPLQPKKQLYQILQNTKLVVIPSYFDSSPTLLAEAVGLGCNVLVSENVGWAEYLSTSSVVKVFEDLKSWRLKAEALLKEPISNRRFEEVVKQAKPNLENEVEKILEYSKNYEHIK